MTFSGYYSYVLVRSVDSRRHHTKFRLDEQLEDSTQVCCTRGHDNHYEYHASFSCDYILRLELFLVGRFEWDLFYSDR